MEEEGTEGTISRRRVLQRLGVGTAVAWLTPIVTSLGSRAEAGQICACEAPCDWTCGGQLKQCGSGCGPLGAAYCSQDVDGNCFCWEDEFCSEITDCVENSDCPSGYACIPGTCCEVPKCFPACGLGPRSRRRHGKLASGRIR